MSSLGRHLMSVGLVSTLALAAFACAPLEPGEGEMSDDVDSAEDLASEETAETQEALLGTNQLQMGISDLGYNFPEGVPKRASATFSAPFAAPPVLLATAQGNLYHNGFVQDTFSVSTYRVNEKGFTLNTFRSDSPTNGWAAVENFSWLAIQAGAQPHTQASTFNVGAGGNVKVVYVPFVTPFPAGTKPKVLLTVRGEYYIDTFTASTREVTNNGFWVNIWRVEKNEGWSQNLKLDWMAWDNLSDFDSSTLDGRTPIPPTTSGPETTQNFKAVWVPFPAGKFSEPPAVVATVHAGPYIDTFAVTANLVSKDGFFANVARADHRLSWAQPGVYVDWIARPRTPVDPQYCPYGQAPTTVPTSVFNPSEGWYRINNYVFSDDQGNTYVEVSGGSPWPGDKIVHGGWGLGHNQRVKFEPAGCGWYRIKFKNSGLYLTVPGNTTYADRFIQWEPNLNDEQLFRLESIGGDEIRIWTRNGKALTFDTFVDASYPFYDVTDEYMTQYSGYKDDWTGSTSMFYKRSVFKLDLIEEATPGPRLETWRDGWGYADRRWMIDINGDGRSDFCRATGNSYGADSWLGCSITTAQGISGKIDTYTPLADWGYADRRWMVDINGDGKTDYCRGVGYEWGANSFLGCSLSTGTMLSPNINLYIPMGDWGYADRRWMVDVNGDMKADYCRAVGESSGPNSYLSCLLSTGTGFSGEIAVQMPDWGPADRRWMADFNGDGKADYCRALNETTMGCTFSTGNGFASGVSATMPMDGWGYADRRWFVDVTGDKKADYCRASGNHSGGKSWLICSPSTGTGFGANIWKRMVDWGTGDTRFMGDVNGDGKMDFGHNDSVDGIRMIFELL